MSASVSSASASEISRPGRVAEASEGITLDELGLAARNHGLPMEALREDVTPPGLHYVLVHYDIPAVDPETWRLDIGGVVDEPLTFDLETLRGMSTYTARVTLECAGNGRAALSPRPISQPWLNGAVGTADWTGVALSDLLDRAGIHEQARSVALTGLDHGIERGVEQDYERGLDIDEAMGDDALVAFEMNGQPIPPQHGFPVRLVVPGWYGMAHVKWLRRITVLGHEYDGYQNSVAYRLRQEPGEVGEAVTRIEPRALIAPPGFPDFMTRERVVRPGAVTLVGRAWSGWAPVNRVEVSTDGGGSWRDAVVEHDALEHAQNRWAWRKFTFDWDAEVGRHELRARATDESGRVQSVEPVWNRGGFANNGDQPIVVHVLD